MVPPPDKRERKEERSGCNSLKLKERGRAGLGLGGVDAVITGF